MESVIQIMESKHAGIKVTLVITYLNSLYLWKRKLGLEQMSDLPI